MDTKQSFLHVSINFSPLQLQSLSFSHITIFLAVILPLIIIHDTFFAVVLPCSYSPLNYHSEQFPLLLHTLSLFVHDTILPPHSPFLYKLFPATILPCSYTPLQLYIIYLIYTNLYFTIYYSITITQYFLLLYIYNPIILYPILYIFLSLLYLKKLFIKNLSMYIILYSKSSFI